MPNAELPVVRAGVAKSLRNAASIEAPVWHRFEGSEHDLLVRFQLREDAHEAHNFVARPRHRRFRPPQLHHLGVDKDWEDQCSSHLEEAREEGVLTGAVPGVAPDRPSTAFQSAKRFSA
mmetsp:Transcript_100396/g.321950  ORF Transcript_100396/g.321950 Transcript_100396/m.321950 type:complete len:119 (+) Transcript_100396:122-478(+)